MNQYIKISNTATWRTKPEPTLWSQLDMSQATQGLNKIVSFLKHRYETPCTPNLGNTNQPRDLLSCFHLIRFTHILRNQFPFHCRKFKIGQNTLIAQCHQLCQFINYGSLRHRRMRLQHWTWTTYYNSARLLPFKRI